MEILIIMIKFRRKLLSLHILAALSGNAVISTANAQEATDNSPSSDIEDVIVITGSRIRRTDVYTSIPVQSFTIDDIESSGTVDIAELITQIPGVGFSLSPESTGLSVQNPGLSTISLRGLGGDRTLTLINGRRAVSNSGNGERVSLNTIPAGFVKRVEVTTGGASAIYGADAIAGVVNILLRNDYDGFKANYRYGEADASGEKENTLDLTFGKNFDNDRGNFMLGFSYDDETAVFADSTRPESIEAIRFDANGQPFGVNLSSNILGGRFEGDDAWNIDGVWFNDQSLPPPDGRNPSIGYETPLDGHNFRPDRSLSPASEVLATAFTGHYDFTENASLFAELYLTQINTVSTNAPRAASSGTDIGPAGASVDIGRMASGHPFIPPEVEETRVGTVSWVRRFGELGFDIKDNQRDTIRSTFGVEGTTDTGWAWTTSVALGKFEQEQVQNNALNYQSVQYALDVEDDGNGGFQCVDAGARANGCVPLNVFGVGSVTAAMADYIRYTGNLNQEREQLVVSASMDGDLFEMDAGSIKAAFGIEYREEDQKTVGDPDNILEETSVSVVPNIDAGFDVMEVYGEIDVPLTETLSAQVALRAGDYSTIGNIFSYNFGGSWTPIPDVRIRTQFSRSQRAPNITEFFSSPRGDFDSLTDPCTGLNADGTGVDPVVSANCLNDAGIQAFFADIDNVGVAFDGDGSVFGPNSGNDQLQEETADTYTFGIVFRPESMPDLSMIIDYYRIEIDGAIGTISTQNTVDLCYNSANFPNNRFCDVITRDNTNGDVAEVINREENLNFLEVEGIDFSVNYMVQFDSFPGKFDFRLIHNRVLTNEQEFEGLEGPELTDFNGEIGDPEYRSRTYIGWVNNDFRLSYTWHYISGGVDDNTIEQDDPDFFKVRSQSYHDVYASYSFDGEGNVQLYGGIRNLLDDLGPILPSGLDSGSSRNIVSSMNSTIGREFYLGVRTSW